MRRLLVLALLLASGCLDDAATTPGGGLAGAAEDRTLRLGAPVVALPSCPDDCFEPSVAVDAAGRVFVTTEDGDALARSTDGGATFERLAPPPRPADAPPALPLPDGHTLELLNVADATVHTDPQGRLWWTALVGAAQAIQVARSDDAGETWAVDVLVSAPADPAAPPPGVDDRQWLGFGADGAAYLTYSHIPVGLYVARSDDGGATWTPFVLVASSAERGGIGLHGPPVVDARGRVLLPHAVGVPVSPLVAETRPPSLALAVSEDRGATWRRLPVVDGAPDLAPYTSPVLVERPDGALDLAWVAWDGDAFALAHARSVDAGATWSAPAVVDRGVADIAAWAAAGPDGVRLAWHLADGSLLVARDAGDAFESAEAAGRGAYTHFVALAVTPEGRAVVAWTEAGTVNVARES